MNWKADLVIVDEAIITENKIEIYSKKEDQIIYEYKWMSEINDDMLEMAKIETILQERPKVMPVNVLKATLEAFDKYFLLIVNGKKLW